MHRRVNVEPGKQGFQPVTLGKNPPTPNVATLSQGATKDAIPASNPVETAIANFEKVKKTPDAEEPLNRPLDTHTAHSINVTFPFPQDMPLEKVSTVVDLINDGDITDEDIAYSLSVSKQQGNYAANAAGYLGFVHRDKDTLPNTLSLTPAGEEFLSSTPEEKISILQVLTSQMDADNIDERGYSDSTIDYRRETVTRWRNWANSETATFATQETRDAALTRTRSGNRPQRITPRPTTREPQYTMCPTCFLALPASGICDDCS